MTKTILMAILVGSLSIISTSCAIPLGHIYDGHHRHGKYESNDRHRESRHEERHEKRRH